mmetsp:Transcript_54372/g.126879  ORF Transcript_54372/g.126879 Transcript_54372/m.126879 type:complete len:88 (-) Transcript_54372:1144-1407(-)
MASLHSAPATPDSLASSANALDNTHRERAISYVYSRHVCLHEYRQPGHAAAVASAAGSAGASAAAAVSSASIGSGSGGGVDRSAKNL